LPVPQPRVVKSGQLLKAAPIRHHVARLGQHWPGRSVVGQPSPGVW